MARSIAAVVLLLCVLASACLAGGAGQIRAQRTYQGECGSCHPRPEREHLDPAGWAEVMERHHDRVALDQDEWKALVEFLGRR